MSVVATESWAPHTKAPPPTRAQESALADDVGGPSALSFEYDVLVSRLKQARREGRAPAIAIVSASSGAGASTVTKALTGKMNAGLKARRTKDVTISVPVTATKPTGSVGEFINTIFVRHEAALRYVVDPAVETTYPPLRQMHDPGYSFEDGLLTARSMFRMVLVECRPHKKSADIASVAYLVDAVLIVVEANKTTRAQTERLVHTIQSAGGTVMGYILNKRTFAVPASVYKFFQKAGLI